jgi:hypothetical protein
MSDNQKEVDIVVDAEEVNKGASEVKVETKDSVSTEDGVEVLRRQLEHERNMRAHAEKKAQEASRAAHNAQNEVDGTNLQLINNAIGTLKRENDIMKANYRAALSSGDYDMAAEIQENMASNAAKLLQLENGKASMEAAPKREAPAPYRAPSDPVEAFAAQLSPRSADWIRRHPECVHDPRLNQKMIAAHNLAMADGVAADTDDYFSFIEGIMRLPPRQMAQQDESPMSSASSGAQRQSAPPAAPVSRSGNATGTRQNVVRLTPDQREMASMMGMTDAEYAKSLLELKKSGRIH